MGMQADEFNAQLHALHTSYRQDLPRLIKEIEALFRSLEATGYQQGCMADLLRTVHSLAGSSGMYGFTEIAKKARDLHDLLSKETTPNATPSWAVLEQAWSHIFALQGHVARLPAADDNLLGGPSAVGERLAMEPLTILLASDDPHTSELLCINLHARGHTVVPTADGKQALITFEQIQPDFLILEVGLPYLNGYNIMRTIRNRRHLPYVPAIFLTSLHNPEDLVRCIESGGDDFATKPIDMDVLAAKIYALQRFRARCQAHGSKTSATVASRPPASIRALG